MKSILKHKKGLGLGDAIPAVMIVSLVFLLMATLAYVGEKYGDAIYSSSDGKNDSAYNITQDLQTEIDNNTDIAGIVLTIVLVGIILTVLVGVFAATRSGGL